MKKQYFTKFCGITRSKDALIAQSLGADALGFVFVKKSKRFITASQCHDIISSLSPTVMTVALFADNSADEIQEVLNKCSIHVLQFHGNETPQFCEQWGRPYWKAIPMADISDPLNYAKKYPNANGYLIDHFGNNIMGGSGHRFDWNKIPSGLSSRWILAGGLQITNIAEARDKSGIRCFDVSSGIEASPGIKSKTLMQQFIKELND